MPAPLLDQFLDMTVQEDKKIDVHTDTDTYTSGTAKKWDPLKLFMNTSAEGNFAVNVDSIVWIEAHDTAI
jgi:hypothetical protein